MQLDPLSILTPILSKLAKKWEGAAQNTNLDKVVQGGSENLIFMLSFEFCTIFFYNVEAYMNVLRSRNTLFFWGLKKIRHFVFQKMLFYVILGYEGAFVAMRQTFRSFDVL